MNKEFLEKYKLQRSIPLKESLAFEKVLIEANTKHVLIWEKKKGVKVGNRQYYDFDVYCPTTNFADAYAYLGLRWAEKVLPIWNKRHSANIKTVK